MSRGDLPAGPEGLLTVGDYIRRNGESEAIRDKALLLFEDRVWTHGEYFEESARFADLFTQALDSRTHRHVGILMDNTPDYLFAIGGAALAGATLVTLNSTVRGEHLRAQIISTDIALVLVEGVYADLVGEVAGDALLEPDAVVVSRRFSKSPEGVLPGMSDLGDRLGCVGSGHRPLNTTVRADDTLILTFTSGTVGLPKAIPWTHQRIIETSALVNRNAGLGSDDVAYMAMPLFHANSVVCNWIPMILLGATSAVTRKFSASRWLDDVRRYGCTYANYVGKPLTYILATPQRPDDANNPVRVMFGNEGASPRLREFSQRFGISLTDTYGTSEGGIVIIRDEATPQYALGPAPEGVKVVDDDGRELPRARFDDQGVILNAAESVGNLVQTNPASATTFVGYYNNDEATNAYKRNGWLWTGDLAYVDEAGYVYYAGRTQEWIRVDGENFIGTPIEETVMRHRDVILASVYGVPDAEAGDQVMVCLATADPARFDVTTFARWIMSQPDMSPKWRPRYLRIAERIPLNGVNKVLKRVLMTEKFRLDRVGSDILYEWTRGAEVPVRFGEIEQDKLLAEFRRNGRERFWDL